MTIIKELELVPYSQFKIATFNLFNYLEPPNAFYEFERIYSAQQWHKKQKWITDYLQAHQPDIIGFQEVFSIDSLKDLVSTQGYEYFSVIDKPNVVDDFIYKSPVVAIASKFPINEVDFVSPEIQLAKKLGLADDFSFNRRVLRATITVPHIGDCDCYVLHLKSKRPMLEVDEEVDSLSPEKVIIESLKAQLAGSWGSTIQRGSEATLLMLRMIERREKTNNPMILMGDFNNTLSDGVLNHLLTKSLRFVSSIDRDAYLEKYCLNDSWELFRKSIINQATENLNEAPLPNNVNNLKTSNQNSVNMEKLYRAPTHYFGGSSSILDYILLSCEFDASYHKSLYEVSAYETYDRHLINPIFDRDGESTDHGIVSITLSLRQ